MTGATGPAATDTAGTDAAGTVAAGADAVGTGRTAAALQSALAAENAAIYGYGVAGAQLGTAARERALRDWTEHEAARDQLQAMLTSLGVKPAAAQPAYRLPFPVHGTPGRDLARGLPGKPGRRRLPRDRRPGRLPAVHLGCRAGAGLRVARDDLAGPDRRLSRAGLRGGSGYGPALSLAIVPPRRPAGRSSAAPTGWA